MVKCSAYKCNSASYNKTPGLSFYRFPKDNDLKAIWVPNMKCEYWQPTSSSVLCSKHFEPHLKDTSAFCTILQPGAIPTLFEYPENKENLPLTVSSRKRCSAGNFVSLAKDEQNYNIPEPQPCSHLNSCSTHAHISSVMMKINPSHLISKEKKRCAVGYTASVLQDVKTFSNPNHLHHLIVLSLSKLMKRKRLKIIYQE